VTDQSVRAELRSMKSTLQQAIDKVQTMREDRPPPTIQQFFLDPRLSSVTRHIDSLAPVPQNSPIIGRPSHKQGMLPQPEVTTLDLQPTQQQSQFLFTTAAAAPSSLPSYCNRFSFVKCGGVSIFFDAIVREKFFLVEEDFSNRLYHWNYPGNNQVAMQLWARGLPDMTVEVKIMSQSAEILKEFVSFLQKNFE